MKTLLALAVVLAATGARAQTYDIDVNMRGYADFTGSFVYSNGVFSDVNVSNPTDGGAFTAINPYGSPGSNELAFYDLEGKSTVQQAGSEVFVLTLTTKRPIGSANPGIVTNSEVYNTDFNSTGLHECGGKKGNLPGAGLRCSGRLTDPPAASVHSVPELDGSHALEAVALLAGLALVVKSRRRAI
jgi:hypothetical protein